MRDDHQACCAHSKVEYVKVSHEGGTCSDSWACADCGVKFWPNVQHGDEKADPAEERLRIQTKQYDNTVVVFEEQNRQIADLQSLLAAARAHLKSMEEQEKYFGPSMTEMLVSDYPELEKFCKHPAETPGAKRASVTRLCAETGGWAWVIEGEIRVVNDAWRDLAIQGEKAAPAEDAGNTPNQLPS